MSNLKKPATGLGKGLDVLIPEDFDSSLLLSEAERVQKVSTDAIHPNREQPRQHFDKQALEELAASIKRYGVLQPLVITPQGKDRYRIIAGERRWRAAQIAGLKTVPAIVRSLKELEQLEIALVENVQRVDLSPLEQALSIQKLHDQFSLDYATIAKRLGKASSSVNNTVRLLQLPESVRTALQEKRITEGHARSVLALKPDTAKQEDLLRLILQNGWSVRQAEQYVTAVKKGAATTTDAKKRLQTSTADTRKLSRAVKAPVRLRRTANGGRLEFGFASEEELQRLLALLLRKLV